MKVAIEARALSAPRSGIRTYVENLTAALSTGFPDLSLHVLEHGPSNSLLLPFWLEGYVPKWIASKAPDIVHYTKSAIPFRRILPRVPTVVTIYDVIPLLFPESQRQLSRLLWPTVLRHAAVAADRIITISDVSKRDIVELLQVDPTKVVVTKLAPARGLEDIENKRIGTQPPSSPYVLFVGTIEPRKNIRALVHAFSRIAKEVPHNLVLAGRFYKGRTEIETEIRRLALQERIVVLGQVSQARLFELYAQAELFVLPSIYEGWGFPAQEAMSFGVPVIVSDGGSLPEVVGDAGEVVHFSLSALQEREHDEDFIKALSERMRSVLEDPVKQKILREDGMRRVATYTWADVASRTAKVYSSLYR